MKTHFVITQTPKLFCANMRHNCSPLCDNQVRGSDHKVVQINSVIIKPTVKLLVTAIQTTLTTGNIGVILKCAININTLAITAL